MFHHGQPARPKTAVGAHSGPAYEQARQNYKVSNQVLHSHEAEYLGYIGLESLDIKKMDADPNILSSLATSLLEYPNIGVENLESAFIADTTIQAIYMYTHVVAPGFAVNLQDLQGFSLVYVENDVLYHALFEKKGEAFAKVPEYQIHLKGGLTVDEIRLLHFSFADSYQSLPFESEIFFIANTQMFIPPGVEQASSFELALKLCLDSSRNAGRFLSVFFMGDKLRLARLPSLPPEEACASTSMCPAENMPFCNALENQCKEDEGGGCVSRQIRKVAEENQVTADVPLIDNMLYYFRDQVLATSVKEKLYIYDFYKFGKFVKTDLAMILKYGATLPKIYSAIDALQKGDGTTVLLDSELADDILDLINDHRDVLNDEFQALLNRMQADVDLFRVRTKNEVLSILADP